MHRTGIRWTAIIVLCLGAALAQASAPAKTPEELIRALTAAAQQGDTEGFLTGLTASSRKAVSEAFAQQTALESARQAFQQALDERFGKGGMMLTASPDDLKTAISRLVGAEILETKPGPGDSVHLRVKTGLKSRDGRTGSREETLLLRKEGGAWKLVLGYAPEKEDPRTTIDKLTAELKQGKFKDRGEAMIALANAFSGVDRKKGGTK